MAAENRKSPGRDDAKEALPFGSDTQLSAGETGSEKGTSRTAGTREGHSEKVAPRAGKVSTVAGKAENSPPEGSSSPPEKTGEEAPVTPQRNPEDPGAGQSKASLLVSAEATEHPRSIPGRKLYQDEIYGTKELSPFAVALIDTPEFQRLTHIFQLGFTYQVFRGANHRRFDHSIGTYFMVRTLMRRVVQNHARFHKRDREAFIHPGLHLSPRLYLRAPATPERWQKMDSPMGRWRGLTEVVSAAALLHDLGHVPVGHTLEDEFSVLGKHDSLGGPRLFEMLYGPREPLAPKRSLSGTTQSRQPKVTDFFREIGTDRLPPPQAWGRICLPWVFEEGIYALFLASEAPADNGQNNIVGRPLQNWELRDLIYLILSFKDDFTEELKKAKEKVTADAGRSKEPEKKAEANAAIQRVSFLDALYTWYSDQIEIEKDRDKKPLFHPFMSDLVGNTICADLLDYLVRDGRRLKLDIRNNARLQRYLVIKARDSAFPKERELRLSINAIYPSGLKRRDTVSDLLDLMSERYRFAEVVYYHPKKAAFSAMLAKAIELMPESQRPREDGSIYPAPWSGANMSNSAAASWEGAPKKAATVKEKAAPHIAHFGDESLIAHLHRAAEKTMKVFPLVDGITYRNEYRLLFTLSYEAAIGDVDKLLRYLRPGTRLEGTWDGRPDLKDDADRGRKQMEMLLEDVVARHGETAWSKENEPPPVLIYCPNQRMQAKEVAAHVELSRQVGVRPLNRQTEDPTWKDIDLLNEKYKRLWRLYIFVHPRIAHILQQDSELASTLIDTFCCRFGVPDEHKKDGCRDDYHYIPFLERLNDHFERWKDQLSGSLPADTPFERIKERARPLALWEEFKGNQAPFPERDGDYRRGFWRAAMSLAADDSKREGWAHELKSIRGDEWWKECSTPALEIKRAAALQKFDECTKILSSQAAARGKPAEVNNWNAVVEELSTLVKGV